MLTNRKYLLLNTSEPKHLLQWKVFVSFSKFITFPSENQLLMYHSIAFAITYAAT